MQIERAGIAQADRAGGGRRGLRRDRRRRAARVVAARSGCAAARRSPTSASSSRLYRYLDRPGLRAAIAALAMPRRARRASQVTKYIQPPYWSMTMTSNEIRASFLKYFEQHGHRVVPSSPLVPGDDPTLLFTNAGMNQFKDLFLGREKRDYTRATTSQKCMRVSGKHNDLDNVGPSHRHHTFFEMLGNFSFGDYFKKDAHAVRLGAADRRLEDAAGPARRRRSSRARTASRATTRPTTSGGSSACPPIASSSSARDDNFWQMGDTGPCGRCSEIYLRARRHRRAIPEIEIWNNVFMEFERQRRRHADAAAGAVDRHRHGPRAHHRGAAGQGVELRHRPVHAAPRPRSASSPGIDATRHA